MIIIKVMGGLGNQMFQYALAKSLSIRNKQEFVLDIHSYETDKLRKYSLNCFNLDVKFIEKDQVDIFYGNKITKMWNKIKYRFIKQRFLHIKEEHSEFCDNIMKINCECFLDGYWQTEKYFKDIRNELLFDFTFKKNLNEKSEIIAKEIKNLNTSISLHVRRSDYITNKTNSNIFYCCDLDYYHRAIEYMRKRYNNPRFYVFSDDFCWVRDKFQHSDDMIFIDHNQAGDSYQDLFLMSLCKHNIIANSSFSWWGAWLNENQGKTVIGPKFWFKDRIAKDLMPDEWIKL